LTCAHCRSRMHALFSMLADADTAAAVTSATAVNAENASLSSSSSPLSAAAVAAAAVAAPPPFTSRDVGFVLARGHAPLLLQTQAGARLFHTLLPVRHARVRCNVMVCLQFVFHFHTATRKPHNQSQCFLFATAVIATRNRLHPNGSHSPSCVLLAVSLFTHVVLLC
jgi:hypothetical protein